MSSVFTFHDLNAVKMIRILQWFNIDHVQIRKWLSCKYKISAEFHYNNDKLDKVYLYIMGKRVYEYYN